MYFQRSPHPQGHMDMGAQLFRTCSVLKNILFIIPQWLPKILMVEDGEKAASSIGPHINVGEMVAGIRHNQKDQIKILIMVEEFASTTWWYHFSDMLPIGPPQAIWKMLLLPEQNRQSLSFLTLWELASPFPPYGLACGLNNTVDGRCTQSADV